MPQPPFYEPSVYALDKKYRWVTYRENCPLCEAMRGRVYTGDLFASSGIYPGFHPHCDCRLELVPSDTPMSPTDIFPDYFVTFLGKWGSILPGGWKPYNIFILDEFMRATPEGGTLWDAINAFKSGTVNDGSILAYPRWRSWYESITWRSWIELMRDPEARVKYTLDIQQGVDDSIFSPYGMEPKPRMIRPVFPGISHYWSALPGRFYLMP